MEHAIKESVKLTEHFPGDEKQKICFRRDKASCVPFVKIALPLTAIKTVVFGPQFGRYEEEEIGIRLLLAVKGVNVDKVRFFRSVASYRS